MPVARDASIVKIAVKPLISEPQHVPQLIEFDQKQPLSSVITELCLNWNISSCEDYSLKFTDSSFEGYVTEKNRNDVKNGCVLKLNFSATKTVSDILAIFKGGSLLEQTRCLQSLALLSSDPTFAAEFINKSGLDLLVKMIEDEKCSGEKLESALKSFTELMDHATVSWEILSEIFIIRNITFINPQNPMKSVIESSLLILENIVQNNSKSSIVEKSVTLENLLQLLRQASAVIQQNTIALINALFIKADENKRKIIATTFSTKQYRSVIFECVLNPNLGTEMTHQLSIFQSLTLGMLEPRMNDRNVDQDAQEKINELRKIAFDGEFCILNAI